MLRPLFDDRQDSGRRLGALVATYGLADPVVLGVTRGGVPVAAEVARRLGAPLDVVVVRKLAVPGLPEVALGAVGELGVRVLDRRTVDRSRTTPEMLEQIERDECAALDSRADRLRSRFPAMDLRWRTAVVVDDGAATGLTAAAGCLAARARGAAHVVLALPVAPATMTRPMGADEMVVLARPLEFTAVGGFYRDFRSVSDLELEEVLEAMQPQPAGGVATDIRTALRPTVALGRGTR